MYENQLDAINWIVNWEHERSLSVFLRSGSRETCFSYLISQVIVRHTQETMQRQASPWPTGRDKGANLSYDIPAPVKPTLPDGHPLMGS